MRIRRFTDRICVRRVLAVVVVALMAGTPMASYANAVPYNPENLAAGEIARIGAVCQSVIRVQPGEEHFFACVDSLSASMKDMDQDRGVDRARTDCLATGLPPGSARLARCTLRTGDSRAAPPRRPFVSSVSDAAAGEPGGDRSYFRVSPEDAHRRNQLACATLGFDPMSRAFAACVAGLQTSLFAADHPMN